MKYPICFENTYNHIRKKIIVEFFVIYFYNKKKFEDKYFVNKISFNNKFIENILII